MNITTHNAQTFSPGDSIILCDTGGPFTDAVLSPPSSGTHGSPITYTNSGRPKIDGTKTATAWTEFTEMPGTDFTKGRTIPKGYWEFTSPSGDQTDGSGHGNMLRQNGGTVSRTSGPATAVANNVLNGATLSPGTFYSISNASLSAGFPGKGTTTGPVSFGLWIKPANIGTTTYPLAMNCEYGLQLTATGIINAYVFNSSYSGTYASSTNPVRAGVWSHIVGTWNSSTGALQIYVNGFNVTTGSPVSPTMVKNRDPLQIGGTGSCANGTNFVGEVSEPFVFGSVLTAAQIASIYNYGLGAASYNVYYAPASANPMQVFEDGFRLDCAADTSTLGKGRWTRDTANGYIWVRDLADDSPTEHTILYSAIANGIYINGRDYLTINGLNVYAPNYDAIYAYGTITGLTITNNTMQWAWMNGFEHGPDTGNSNDLSLFTFVGNSVHDNGGSGVFTTTTTPSNWIIANNNIQGNAAVIETNGSLITSSDQEHYYSAGMHLICHIAGCGSNILISNNKVGNTGPNGAIANDLQAGIWPDGMAGVIVLNNTVYDNAGPGITLEKTINSTAAYNVLYNNSKGSIVTGSNVPDQGTGSINVRVGETTNSTGCNIIGNTIYGGWWGIAIYSDDTSTVSNCLIANNVAINSASYELYGGPGGDNDGTHGSGNVYTHNAFGVAYPNFLWWAGTPYSTYAAWEEADGNCGMAGCSYSMQLSPELINSSEGVFTLSATSPARNAGISVSVFPNLHGTLDLGANP